MQLNEFPQKWLVAQLHFSKHAQSAQSGDCFFYWAFELNGYYIIFAYF